MTTQFRVTHVTEYRYDVPMADAFTATHLTPRPARWQRVTSSALQIEPEPDELAHGLDVFGNPVTHFAVHRPHSSLRLRSTIEVDVSPGVLPDDDVPWHDVAVAAAAATGELATEVRPYLAHTAQTPLLTELAGLTAAELTPGRGVVASVRGLCHRIFTTFRFDAGFSDVTTPLDAVLAERRGVCQDFAHVTVAALRSVGLPARYVSGYIETAPPPGTPKLVGVDASHAWCSVWAGPFGWIDLDPTNDQLPPQRHITVGWGRDYHDVAPVRGVVIGPAGGQTLTVAVDVTALD